MSLLFIGNNPYIDDIIRHYLLKDGQFLIITDEKRISDVEKVVYTTTSNLSLVDRVFKKPTIIFTTDILDKCWIKYGGSLVKIYQFITPFLVCQAAIEGGITWEYGENICELHDYFENNKGVFDEKQPSSGFLEIIYPRTNFFPTKDDSERYFGKSLLKMKCGFVSLFGEGEGDREDIKPPLFYKKKKQIGIFLVTYNRIEKAKNCIRSLIEAIRYSPHEWYIFIGDNNTKDSEFHEWLDMLTKDRIDKLGRKITNPVIKVYKSSQNIGKSGIVNLMYNYYIREKNSPQVDYIFSMDGDMEIPHPFHPPRLPHLHHKDDEGREIKMSLDGMIDVLDRCRNIGIVSSHQTGECHHWFGKGVVERGEIGYHLGESKIGEGISGGCICMLSADWEKIGMYNVGYDVYLADDAMLMTKVEKILGKRAVIAMDYKLYHPPPVDEDEKGYKEWKIKRFQEDGLGYKKSGHKGIMKGYYD